MNEELRKHLARIVEALATLGVFDAEGLGFKASDGLTAEENMALAIVGDVAAEMVSTGAVAPDDLDKATVYAIMRMFPNVTADATIGAIAPAFAPEFAASQAGLDATAALDQAVSLGQARALIDPDAPTQELRTKKAINAGIASGFLSPTLFDRRTDGAVEYLNLFEGSLRGLEDKALSEGRSAVIGADVFGQGGNGIDFGEWFVQQEVEPRAAGKQGPFVTQTFQEWQDFQRGPVARQAQQLRAILGAPDKVTREKIADAIRGIVGGGAKDEAVKAAVDRAYDIFLSARLAGQDPVAAVVSAIQMSPAAILEESNQIAIEENVEENQKKSRDILKPIASLSAAKTFIQGRLAIARAFNPDFPEIGDAEIDALAAALFAQHEGFDFESGALPDFTPDTLLAQVDWDALAGATVGREAGVAQGKFLSSIAGFGEAQSELADYLARQGIEGISDATMDVLTRLITGFAEDPSRIPGAETFSDVEDILSAQGFTPEVLSAQGRADAKTLADAQRKAELAATPGAELAARRLQERGTIAPNTPAAFLQNLQQQVIGPAGARLDLARQANPETNINAFLDQVLASAPASDVNLQDFIRTSGMRRNAQGELVMPTSLSLNRPPDRAAVPEGVFGRLASEAAGDNAQLLNFLLGRQGEVEEEFATSGGLTTFDEYLMSDIFNTILGIQRKAQAALSTKPIHDADSTRALIEGLIARGDVPSAVTLPGGRSEDIFSVLGMDTQALNTFARNAGTRRTQTPEQFFGARLPPLRQEFEASPQGILARLQGEEEAEVKKRQEEETRRRRLRRPVSVVR